MKWRSHGANPDKMYQQAGIEMPESVLDFSTNTNVVKTDMNLSLDVEALISEYPDDESVDIRRRLAYIHDLVPENFLVVNGTNSAIYMIASIYGNLAILQPTYSEYEKAALVHGKKVINISSMNELPEDTGLLVICNPNNPTGRYFQKEELEKIVKECAGKDIDVMIDEAYVDFLKCRHNQLYPGLLDNVFILRSLTKIYHLSGIRLGYVISGIDKIKALKELQPTWSVNSIAQAVGIRYLQDDSIKPAVREYYTEETRRLTDAVRDIGYRLIPSEVHYFLMEVDDDEKLICFMLKKGIVIRHTRNFPGLDGAYVRICTREKESNDLLIEALREYKETVWGR